MSLPPWLRIAIGILVVTTLAAAAGQLFGWLAVQILGAW